MDFKVYRPKSSTKTEVRGVIKPTKIIEDDLGITLNLELPLPNGKTLTITGVRVSPPVVKNEEYLQIPLKSLQYATPESEPIITELGCVTLHIPTILESNGITSTDDNIQSLEKPSKKGVENGA